MSSITCSTVVAEEKVLKKWWTTYGQTADIVRQGYWYTISSTRAI